MLSVDLVCDSELLPRLQLLARHMESFDVKLRLHSNLHSDPPTHPLEVVILAPVKGKVIDSDHSEENVIGLYLEPQQTEIEASYHVHIPTWPARSSDPDVEALAKHLKTRTSVMALGSTEADQRATPKPRAQARRKSERRRNRVVLAASLIVLIALVQLLPVDSDDAENTVDLSPPSLAKHDKQRTAVPTTNPVAVQSKMLVAKPRVAEAIVNQPDVQSRVQTPFELPPAVPVRLTDHQFPAPNWLVSTCDITGSDYLQLIMNPRQACIVCPQSNAPWFENYAQLQQIVLVP